MFWSLSVFANAQDKKDIPEFVLFKDEFGIEKKVLVVYPEQILIVDRDSIYTVLNDYDLRKILEKKESFKILTHPDSIRLFLMDRIKSIIIIGPKKEK